MRNSPAPARLIVIARLPIAGRSLLRSESYRIDE